MRDNPEDEMSASTHQDEATVHRIARGLVEYDSVRRRVWVCGQRLHHGLTGALVTACGVAGLAAHRMSPKGGVEWALLGSMLMAHDWHDRRQWFEPGHQSDD